MTYRQNTNIMASTFSIPNVRDWDGDGDYDLIVGCEPGYIWFIENIDPSGGLDYWREMTPLKTADGKIIRMCSPRTLQGPGEDLWGYVNPCVADWDLDGDFDIIAGWNWQDYLYWENIGSATAPQLVYRGLLEAKGAAIQVPPRTRPAVGDINSDGLPDLIGINGEGHIAWWPRRRENGKLVLDAEQAIRNRQGQPWQRAFVQTEMTGRTKLSACDWDKDGRCDLFSHDKHGEGNTIYFYRNVSEGGNIIFEEQAPVQAAGPFPERYYGNGWGHYSMIEPVDTNGDGNWEMFSGSDAGNIYYFGESF